MIFKLESPESPGGREVGKYMRMHKQGEDETQLKKTANFCHVEARHIFVLEYKEGG